MEPHEEFLELCAAATTGELTAPEQQKLNAHLAECPDCRRAAEDYEVATRETISAMASDVVLPEVPSDSSWSVDKAEKAFFKRLDSESVPAGEAVKNEPATARQGQRFVYQPLQFRSREIWMSLAAVLLLGLALGIVAYRSGMKRGTETARTTTEPIKDSTGSLEERASDAGHERAQLLAKLQEQDELLADLKRQLLAQQKTTSALMATDTAARGDNRPSPDGPSSAGVSHRDEDLAAAQAKLSQLQKTIDGLNGQRDEITMRAATLEAKVGELTELVRERDREIDQKEAEAAKQQDLLEHDRDIRELMGARDLYVAEVHDVNGTGQTNKTYGRIFFTKAKRLIFYAYDLDAEPGLRNASTFQAWGRRGPDKKQALNLGIFYEDNASKKRWVLKANDPKTLNDIDAVFVTVEPDGGSQRPSGKQLLFAYLRVTPNHP